MLSDICSEFIEGIFREGCNEELLKSFHVGIVWYSEDDPEQYPSELMGPLRLLVENAQGLMAEGYIPHSIHLLWPVMTILKAMDEPGGYDVSELAKVIQQALLDATLPLELADKDTQGH